MITVHIVDDHKILVEGLKKLVDNSGFARTTAVSYTGKDCLWKLNFQQPQVILLDINLPDWSGIDLCNVIKEKYPQVKVVALTSYSEYSIVRQMLENGASGYIIKNAMPEEILLGLQAVTNNETFLCEEIDLLMNKRSLEQIWLTPREKVLLKYIVDGYTNPEIAEQMFLAVDTINNYRKKLLCKLNARNTAVLVRIALEQKLV
ncbi:MAG: response regulator transcription factor [Petrimonas sp.]|uniref:response regulator n=1 Tax=Petrimonas sp. TaxID=2023866 RepID=UPI002B3D7A0B|nr:response regulator transcription factor [Petrimonas sp.]MEA5063279.1 response regulator transcription factor [Petrimonas sp.]